MLCAADVAQTNGVFELRLKSGGGQEGVWTIDMKKDGRVYAGAAKPKADVTLLMDDGVFMQMAAGEVRAAFFSCVWDSADTVQLDGQKAYLSGKLKTKGNMMLATKLTAVLQVSSSLHIV
jgi:putative sterol carrier protein